MRIFKLSIFLGLCTLCTVLDFLFLETDYNNILAAFPVAAAILGGASLLSGLGNVLSNESANETNKEIAKENRDWQMVENEKARKYSSQMWEKENVYNTPSAQMQRYSDAGLNPYLVNGQGASAGNAGAANQPSQQGAPNSVQVKPNDFGFIGRAADNAISAYNSVRSVDANVANQSAETEKTIINNAHELYRLTGDKNRVNDYIDSQLKGSKGAAFDPDTSPLARSLKADINRQEMEADRADSERAMNDAKSSVVRLLGYRQGLASIRNLDAMTEKYFGEVNKLSSDVNVNKANINYINKKAYAVGSEMAKNFAEAHYFGAQGKQINALTEYVVDKTRYDAKNSWINALQNGLSYSQRMSDWRSNKLVRDYRESEEGQDRLLWNYQQSPEGNAVNSFLNGFTNSLNIMHGSDVFNSRNLNAWP